MNVGGAIVVDLDGTLCDVTHRKHILEQSGKDRWERYAMACADDLPVFGVRDLIRAYKELGYFIALVSGRSEKAYELTRGWLDTHTVPFDQLIMRQEGSYISNVELKRQAIEHLMATHEIRLIVDDHEGVIDMALAEFSIPGIHVVGRPPYGYQTQSL